MVGAQFTNVLNIIFKAETKAASTAVAGLRDIFKDVDKGVKKASKSVNTFDMRMLGLMFSGMALQRAFSGVLRSIFNTFQKAEGLTNNLTKATVSISAAWEFLKFSIFNALNQSGAFMWLIDGLISGVNWLSKMINKFPILGLAIVSAFGVLAATGAVMMILGQFFLGWAAIFGPGGLLAAKAVAGLGTSAAATGTVVGAASTAFSAILAIFAAGIVVLVTLKVADFAIPKLQEIIAEKKAFFPEDISVEGIGRRIGSGLGAAWEGVKDFFQRDFINIITGEFDNYGSQVEAAAKNTNKFTSAVIDLDKKIFTESLQPSMVLLNKEFNTSNMQTQSLIEKYPSLTEETDNHTSSVNRLAEAYNRLAEARKDSAGGFDEETNADGTGGR